jgi:hypothetical protein
MEDYINKQDFSEKGINEFYDKLMEDMKKLVSRGNADEIIRDEKLSQFNLLETKREIYDYWRKEYSKGLKSLAKAKIIYFKYYKKENKSIDDEIMLGNLKKSIDTYEKNIEELSISAKKDIERINKGIEELIVMGIN